MGISPRALCERSLEKMITSLVIYRKQSLGVWIHRLNNAYVNSPGKNSMRQETLPKPSSAESPDGLKKSKIVSLVMPRKKRLAHQKRQFVNYQEKRSTSL